MDGERPPRRGPLRSSPEHAAQLLPLGRSGNILAKRCLKPRRPRRPTIRPRACVGPALPLLTYAQYAPVRLVLLALGPACRPDCKCHPDSLPERWASETVSARFMCSYEGV